ncbi:Rieske domain-containing protein-like [Saccoglossus kowalevskii]|uniref:Rieske domain-containing protein-like n=1 Tax=Saccoglossus kowalevskii TaxID=10224 RepID=A0ABM0GZ77_SACKO|nr:PREDICTED: Rieske domain-containing protein-like [Saccoglossus kowalevskii]
MEHSGGDLFFKVEKLLFEELFDWSDPKQRCNVHNLNTAKRKLRRQSSTPAGNLVHMNGQKIALFRYSHRVYAINEQCPHAGGPLHIGDIEELPGNSLCLRCPWHSWKFDLETGKVKHPNGRDIKTVVYPTKIDDDGNIYIGFDQFSSHVFQSLDF